VQGLSVGLPEEISMKINKLGKLEHESLALVGKLRRGSSLTRTDTLNCLRKIGRCMQAYGLNSIQHMKPSHISRYFAALRNQNLSAGRMANHATAMRLLCRMMGKPEIMPSNRELGCARDLSNRTKNADIRMNPEKVAEVRPQLSNNNCIAYDMARHFGLRQKEALLSYRTIDRDGVKHLIVAGAKGGRYREIQIHSDDQRAVLRQNLECRASNKGQLIDSDKDLQQGLKQLQNELSAAGANRISGANMHTLRREWIIERCLEILQAPKAYRENLLNELVEAIGHGRTEVIRAYTKLLG